MTPQTRRSLLYGALIVTALAAFLAPEEDQDRLARDPVSTAVPQSPEPGPSAAASDPASTFSLNKRTQLSALPKDLFHIDPLPSMHAEVAPQDEEQQALAPPLPYVYMGKSVGPAETTIFLTRDQKPYVAREGDVLDDQYRIDAINPPVLEFTYLPLEQKQLLHIGGSK